MQKAAAITATGDYITLENAYETFNKELFGAGNYNEALVRFQAVLKVAPNAPAMMRPRNRKAIVGAKPMMK